LPNKPERPPQTASPVGAGLAGKCPRCGEGPLFTKGLVLRERCTRCSLDYTFIDTGDGPAVFAIFLLGAIMLGAALYAEFKYNVSVLFHVIAWGIATPILAFLLLRLLKGLLIGLQYQNKAEEGRLKRD
jgi:uncharacterized protein (DUF983 family)